MRNKRWTDRLKDPIIPGDGWSKIVKKFALKDGEVLLIQYNEGHEPPPEVVESLSGQIKELEVNATVLLLPAELRAEHVPLNKVGDLLDVILELADNALREGRKNGQASKGVVRGDSGAEGKCGMAQRGGQSADDGRQGADTAQG
jgi:hypothetical protein